MFGGIWCWVIISHHCLDTFVTSQRNVATERWTQETLSNWTDPCKRRRWLLITDQVEGAKPYELSVFLGFFFLLWHMVTSKETSWAFTTPPGISSPPDLFHIFERRRTGLTCGSCRQEPSLWHQENRTGGWPSAGPRSPSWTWSSSQAEKERKWVEQLTRSKFFFMDIVKKST